MKIEVNENTLASIQNPVLRSYVEKYNQIYKDYMDQVLQSGIEIETVDETGGNEARIARLRKKGAVVRNDSKSIYVNRISPGCQTCHVGMERSTLFISLKCHRDCFYCFNPNQENYEYYRDHTRDTMADLDSLYASNPHLKNLALTGGEPLLHKDETIEFFKRARELFPKVYTRLYTSGDHVDQATLQALRNAKLDEIRFSIRMHDLAKGQRHTYDRIALARDYIPQVMVEMPVLPGTLEEMKKVLTELERLKIYGINLLEFCFPFYNAEVFRKKGYKIKARPYRVLYNYEYGGGLSISGSEEICLELVEFVIESGMKLGVHYCSLENKNTGQIHQQNSIRPIPKTMFFSQTDYFLKNAKVFGEDIALVEDFFKKNGNKNYEINEEYNYIAFHVSQIRSLKKLNVEVGLSSNVIENRDGNNYVRELKVEVTTPVLFQLSKDV